MSEEVKTCSWCGKSYVSHRPSSRFCSPACRVASHRSSAGGKAVQAEPTIGQDELAAAIVQLKGAVATLSAASTRGPAAMRHACGAVALVTASALKAEGL